MIATMISIFRRCGSWSAGSFASHSIAEGMASMKCGFSFRDSAAEGPLCVVPGGGGFGGLETCHPSGKRLSGLEYDGPFRSVERPDETPQLLPAETLRFLASSRTGVGGPYQDEAPVAIIAHPLHQTMLLHAIDDPCHVRQRHIGE